jgi:hypothetical protein
MTEYLAGSTYPAYSNAFGNVKTKFNLVVTITALLALPIGDLVGSQKLRAAITPQASTNVNAKTRFDLIALSESQAAVVANLKGAQEFEVLIEGQCGAEPGTNGCLFVDPRYAKVEVNSFVVVSGNVKTIFDLIGSADGVVLLEANLRRRGDIAALVDGTASIVGLITSTQVINTLMGTSSAEALAIANLEGVQKLQTTISSQASTSANVKSSVDFISSIKGETSVVGSPILTSTILVGTTSSQTLIIANLKGIQELSELIASESSAVASLSGTQKLIVASAEQCSIEAILTRVSVLRAAASSQASTIANLKSIQELIGRTDPTYSDVQGNAKAISGLIGNPIAQASIVLTLRMDLYLNGSITADSSATTSLVGVQELAGILIGECEAEGRILADLRLLKTEVIAEASVIINIKTLTDLISSVDGTASTTADFSVVQSLAGSATSLASVIANVVGVQEFVVLVAGECGTPPGVRASLTVTVTVLNGTSLAEALAAVNLSITSSTLAGASSAVCSIDADLQAMRSLAGISDAACNMMASLKTVQRITGATSDECEVILSMIVSPRHLSGSIVTCATTQASILEQIRRSCIFVFNSGEYWTW